VPSGINSKTKTVSAFVNAASPDRLDGYSMIRAEAQVPIVPSPPLNGVGRKKVQRAFTGCAGSPLAVVELTAKTPPLSGKERARRFRERQGDVGRKNDAKRKATERIAAQNDLPTQAKRFNKKLSEAGLGMSRGMYLPGAPSGKGLLVTGGYDSEKIELVAGFQDEKDSSIRRVAPAGNGSDEESGAIVSNAKGTRYVRSSAPGFLVHLDGTFEASVDEVVEELFECNDDVLCCDLCKATVEWHKDRRSHVEEFHGAIVLRRRKERDRAHRKLERAAKKAADLRSERELAAVRQQAKREGWGQRLAKTGVTDKPIASVAGS
jgi:hypothetical protein